MLYFIKCNGNIKQCYINLTLSPFCLWCNGRTVWGKTLRLVPPPESIQMEEPIDRHFHQVKKLPPHPTSDITQNSRREAIVSHYITVWLTITNSLNSELMLQTSCTENCLAVHYLNLNSLSAKVCKHTIFYSLTVSLSYSASVEGDTRVAVPTTPMSSAGSRLCSCLGCGSEAVAVEFETLFLGNCLRWCIRKDIVTLRAVSLPFLLSTMLYIPSFPYS